MHELNVHELLSVMNTVVAPVPRFLIVKALEEVLDVLNVEFKNTNALAFEIDKIPKM